MNGQGRPYPAEQQPIVAPPLASRAIRRACRHQFTKHGYCWTCGTKVSK